MPGCVTSDTTRPPTRAGQHPRGVTEMLPTKGDEDVKVATAAPPGYQSAASGPMSADEHVPPPPVTVVVHGCPASVLAPLPSVASCALTYEISIMLMAVPSRTTASP